MKQLLLLLMMLLSLAANAQTVEIDGIYYSLSSSKKTAQLTSNPNGYTGDIVLPATISYNGDDYDVTSIGYRAFYGCKGLTSITIPNSVTSIETRAFENCDGLTSVHISSIVSWCQIQFVSTYSNPLIYAKHLFLNGEEIRDLIIPEEIETINSSVFDGCSGLTSVTISNSVTTIGDGAFRGCSGLTSVIIPNSVTSIGQWAFERCNALMSVVIPNSVTTIGYGAFRYCSGLISVTISNSLTTIGDEVFSGCIGLTSVTIPNSVTSIGSYAFQDCSGLTSMAIPESVTSIGSGAFSGCSSLTSIAIPESVTSIGSYAFQDCSGLASFIIPNGVKTIEEKTFYGCNGLTSIIIPDGVTSIGDFAFGGCKLLSSMEIPSSVMNIGNYAFSNCNSLTSVIIPEKVTSIANSVFYGCRGLTSINIPESVTAIGNSAFYNCSGLTTVTIPNSVTSIGEKAFQNCSKMVTLLLSDNLKMISNSTFSYCWNLTSITIPASVEYIYADAFGNCSALEKVKVLAETPPFLHDKAFSKYDIPLMVPVGCKEAYQSAQGWKNFTDISDSRYQLTYMVDGEEYKSYIIEYGTAITPEAEPTKETYKFSGWSDIPEAMPAHDVVVTGTFARYFDVGNLTKAINFVMKSNASAEETVLYDLNNNEKMDVGDVILIVKFILSNIYSAPSYIGRRAGEITDLAQYTAAQFEVKTAGNVDIRLVKSMEQTHQLMYQQKDANTYAVVVYSLSNQLMQPENGKIIETDNDSDILSIENATVATPTGETVYYQTLSATTGIEKIENENGTAVIYDLKGNRLNGGKAMNKGIYIVNGKKAVVR